MPRKRLGGFFLALFCGGLMAFALLRHIEVWYVLPLLWVLGEVWAPSAKEAKTRRVYIQRAALFLAGFLLVFLALHV